MENSLWKHINHTTSQPFVANPADSLLRDGEMPRSRRLRVNTLTDQQLRLHLDILHLLQVGRNPGFIESGIGGSHAAFEIELEFFDREGFRDQVQGGTGRETGSMFC